MPSEGSLDSSRASDREQNLSGYAQTEKFGPNKMRAKWGDKPFVEGEHRINALGDASEIYAPLREGSAEQRMALEEAKAGRGMGALQLKAGLGSAAMQQAAMAASGGPMAQRAAAMAGAQQASQGVGQAAMVRQQEMAAARQGLQGALQSEAAGVAGYKGMALQQDLSQAQHHAQMSAENRLETEADRKFAIGVAKTAISAVGAIAASDPRLKGAYSPPDAKEGAGGGGAKSQPVGAPDMDASLAMLSRFENEDAIEGMSLREQAGLLSDRGIQQEQGVGGYQERRKDEEMREALEIEADRRQAQERADEWHGTRGTQASQDYIDRVSARAPSMPIVDRSSGAYFDPGPDAVWREMMNRSDRMADKSQAASAKAASEAKAAAASGWRVDQKTAETARSTAEWAGENPYEVNVGKELVAGSAAGGAMKGAGSDPKLKKGRKKSAKRAQAHPEGSYFIEGAESQGFEPRFMLGTAKESGLGPDERYLSRRNFPSHRRASASWLQPTDRRMAQALEADRTMEDLDTYHYEYKPEYQKRLGLPAGHRIGVMADELEDTPLGEAAVRDTEEGKVIDRDNYLFGVVTPGLQRLHERLESLEKKKKGRK